jgi:Secretion system C-terminal sorting domain
MKKALVFILCICAGHLWSQIQIDSITNQPASIENLFLSNGIFVNNIVFQGDSAQFGSFQNGNDVNLGLNSGIVMSTGHAMGSMAGNSYFLTNGQVSTNADLSTLTGFTTYDLAQIDFDFIATGDSMTFQFVFASVEYPEWVGSSFNDIFGFFLSGPGIAGTFTNGAVNIALVPGTGEFVSINTINATQNANLYIDNTANLVNFMVDGYTVPMFATIGGLSVGEAYHITLAIADASDTALESYVFLGGSSFQQFCTVGLLENQDRGSATCLLSNIKADFDYTAVCGTIELENQSTVVLPVANAYYDMGDGNFIPATQTVYTYQNTGNYNVRLVYETADGYSSYYTLGTFPISEVAPAVPQILQSGMTMVVNNYDGTSYVEWFTSIDGGITFQEADGVNGPELNLALYSTFPTHVYAGVSNGCQNTSPVVIPMVSVNELEWVGNGLYPQPAEDIVYFTNSAQKNVNVYTLQGQLVLQANQVTAQLNIESLSSGMYLIQTTTDSVNFETSKLIVK